MDFANKVVLVTGAARGIGQATAVAFGKAGATVLLVDQDAQGLAETQRLLQAAGGQGDVHAMDVTDEAAWVALAEQVGQSYGRLDCAANIAGIVEQPSPIAQSDTAEFRQVMDVNVTGMYLAMKHELPLMQAAGGGSIVNATSYVSVVAFPSVISYVASKHAVAGLTKAVALEFARQNIRINCVGPGPIDAGMLRIFFEHAPEAKQALADSVPMGRLGEGDEVAQAVLWLCSDAASFVTGTTMFVDGGALIQ